MMKCNESLKYTLESMAYDLAIQIVSKSSCSWKSNDLLAELAGILPMCIEIIKFQQKSIKHKNDKFLQ